MAWEDGRSGYYNIYAKTSTDAGATWSPDTALTSEAHASETPSVVVVDSDVYVVWSAFFINAYEIWFRRSTDAGTTWDPSVRLVQTLDIGSGQPCVAAADSCVNVVWHDDMYANFEIIQKRSSDRGLTWGDAVRLTSHAGTSQSPSIAARDSLVHLVWEDDRYGLGDIFYLRSTNSGASWEPETRLTTDTAASQFPSVVAGDDIVHVVWQDYRDGNNEVYYKRWLDATGTGSGIIPAPPVGALTPSSNPFVSSTRIRSCEHERFIVTDALGRPAGVCRGACVGQNLQPGVYFLRRAERAGAPLRLVKLF